MRLHKKRLESLAAAGLLVSGLLWNASADVFGAPSATESSPQQGAPATPSLGADRIAALRQLAGSAARTLALPVETSLTMNHVVDRLSYGEYDEVVGFDALNRPLWVLRFGDLNDIRTAVRFGVRQANRALGRTAIAATAGRLARRLNLPGGPATITRDQTNHQWEIRWQRSLNGIPVGGDGAWLTLWADGSLHLFGQLERPNAARPAEIVSSNRATEIVQQYLDQWFAGPARADVATSRITLGWVSPNAMFRPDRPIEPDPVLRLALIVEVAVSGPTRDRLTALEVYLDAGTGDLLGGDVAS